MVWAIADSAGISVAVGAVEQQPPMQPPLPGALAATCAGIALGAYAAAASVPSSAPRHQISRSSPVAADAQPILPPPPQAQLAVNVDPLSLRLVDTRLDAFSMVGQAASGASLPLTRVSLRKDDAEPSIDDLEDHDAEPQSIKY